MNPSRERLRLWITAAMALWAATRHLIPGVTPAKPAEVVGDLPKPGVSTLACRTPGLVRHSAAR